MDRLFRFRTWFALAVVAGFACVIADFALCGRGLDIVNDSSSENPVGKDEPQGQPPGHHPDSEHSTADPTLGSPRSEPSVRPDPIPVTENQKTYQRLRRQAFTKFRAALGEEHQRMLKVVHRMDRPTAIKWLSSFISSPQFGCPVSAQHEWIEAILFAVQRNGLPICAEILGLTAGIVAIESSFHADPLAVDPGGGEDMSALLARAEKELKSKLGPLLFVPPVPTYYERYRNRYYPLLMACRTEGQVEKVAEKIAADLKRDSRRLPDLLQTKVLDGIRKLTNVVRTKGAMQLNFTRARLVMQDRGVRFTDEQLRDYMYTLKGGLDVGIAALKPMFVQYAARYAVPGDLSWLFFVGMDYHYGPFSSRNMMEQIRIRDLSGVDIPLDGDFLLYDEDGFPEDRRSKTAFAVGMVFPRFEPRRIFEDFALEKDPVYVYTEIHQAIVNAHRERFGESPFAVIGELWMGKDALIKYGILWKTRAYLDKLDRRLNSIPW